MLLKTSLSKHQVNNNLNENKKKAIFLLVFFSNEVHIQLLVINNLFIFWFILGYRSECGN